MNGKDDNEPGVSRDRTDGRFRWLRVLWWVCVFFIDAGAVRQNQLIGIQQQISPHTPARLFRQKQVGFLFKQLGHRAQYASHLSNNMGDFGLMLCYNQTFLMSTDLIWKSNVFFRGVTFQRIRGIPGFFVLQGRFWDWCKSEEKWGGEGVGVNALFLKLSLLERPRYWIPTLRSINRCFQ